MRLRVLFVSLALAGCTSTFSARAAQAEDAVEALERTRAEAFATRRTLATSVLVAGGVSLVGGGVLIVPSGNDQAWRFAGINTAVFGAVNTVVGLFALHGIHREESAWEASAAARRTPAGLAAATAHAAEDERRESVGHAINLGLDAAYLGVGGSAILASQLGVDHPNRWLASGAAIGVQSLFLIAIDTIGLTTSGAYHRSFVSSCAPSVSITPNATGSALQVGVQGGF